MHRALVTLASALWIGAAAASLPIGGGAPVHLEQGWSEADRAFFYRTTQGSRMMPLSWLLALDLPDGREPFLGDGLARHGFLPSGAPTAGLAALPVGFAVDGDRPDRRVGLTCAACHTGQLEYRGHTLRIDGGPADADLFGLFVELREALAATLADPARFDRFAKAVLRDPSASRSVALRADVAAFLADWDLFVEGSTTEVAWGPGRLDGFGMTFNRLAALGLSEPENNSPPVGAASYPFLWGSSWHDRTQWIGVVEHDDDLGRLARNVGEVLGVFAEARLRPPGPGRRYYRTSADRDNLGALEDLVKRLRAPAWPEEILGPIDRERAAAGAEIYRVHCASCHPVVPQGSSVRVEMTPVAEVGTDALLAWSICSRTVRTGRLEGAVLNPLLGAPLPGEVRGVDFLNHVVAGAILAPDRGILSGLPAVPPAPARRVPAARPDPDCGPAAPLMRYKARPIEGVWATAPFLHNGSVPTLYELLLPSDRRVERFRVGGRRFDPVDVGLARGGGPRGRIFDTTLPGNSRKGHDYATGELTERQRRELVEYLKTL